MIEIIDGVVTFKYVNDTTVFEAVDMLDAVKHLTTGRTTEVLLPAGLSAALNHIAIGARKIGMKVNVRKTQLLCISPRNGCNTAARVLTTDGEHITSWRR